ncbi:hypothetical protein [Bacillus sp. (in: firmicutes)]|uniref:hypothetical protein n=1 Tax=Bacillus sp. TaxID=1409 RepID=UPI000EC4927D|nr:hypothetical protein [Bacillus sp. (in: firmicutes)]HCO78338.1 hypothetical protein [Bacillus sp. (in: firmicutes)]
MIIINNNSVNTAYVDLKSIQKLILCSVNDKEFLSTHIYSILRDICLILDEVFCCFIPDKIEIDERIKLIRNRVHLFFKKKGRNQKIYNNIIDYHISVFGDDINNIGFYMNKEEEIVGSTLYSTYILLNIETFPLLDEEPNTKYSIFYLAKYIGEVSTFLIEFLENKYGISPNTNINVEKISSNPYKCWDINHQMLFKYKSDASNSFILRLILSLQEINDAIWIKDTYVSKLINPNFLDDYIHIRLITLKTDEIIDNLLNLRTYSKDDFEKWNNISNGRINSLLEDFEKDIKTVCSIMRNMVHYDITSEERIKTS